MRRFLILALASVGVLIASAILDVSSRASAAYLSTTSRAVGAEEAGAGARNDTPEYPSHSNYKPVQLHLLVNQPAGTGAGTTTSGNSTSNPTSPAAEIPPKELPQSNLVVYFREPATHLELTKYIDSILDPPRQA